MHKPSLSEDIKRWGREAGFQQLGITGTCLDEDETHLVNWLSKGWHGDMTWMARHGTVRSRPQALLPGTVAVLSARMDYFPAAGRAPEEVLQNPELGYISRYALGRDYHKLLRKRLQGLCTRIEQAIGPFAYRCFSDSAPVLEKALARNAGLGWIGKHTNLIHPQAGSWFFLAEVYTNLPLATERKHQANLCGSCTACMQICPTQAIVGERQLDARRCLSYLTIEHPGPIPVEFRKALGNRIYGCDDCQLVCPWNRFAQPTAEADFAARHDLDQSRLTALFAWDEKQFLKNMEGSAIRRIGYERWQRNLAVALGNAPSSPAILQILQDRLSGASPLVREHILWSLNEHRAANLA